MIIEITVAQDGSTKVETKGFEGNRCSEATRFLERSLGCVTSDKRTAEFYARGPSLSEATRTAEGST